MPCQVTNEAVCRDGVNIRKTKKRGVGGWLRTTDQEEEGGGKVCVRADNREIDDEEQGVGGGFCRPASRCTDHRGQRSIFIVGGCLPNILAHKCIERERENEFPSGKNGNWLAVIRG